MKSLAAVLPSPTRTAIAPLPTALSPTLPHGLTAMAGSMTPQQFAAAMTPRAMPLNRDEGRVLQQWWQAMLSCRTSARAGRDTDRSTTTRPLPDGVTLDMVQDVIVEMVRPACPESVIRVSQVMARKPLFNNDEISARNAIADTHELLARYSDFVYFKTCQEAMESDDRYFPIPAQWLRWADEKAFLLNSLRDYFAA